MIVQGDDEEIMNKQSTRKNTHTQASSVYCLICVQMARRFALDSPRVPDIPDISTSAECSDGQSRAGMKLTPARISGFPWQIQNLVYHLGFNGLAIDFPMKYGSFR